MPEMLACLYFQVANTNALSLLRMPATLNAHSISKEVAGMHKYFRTIKDKRVTVHGKFSTI